MAKSAKELQKENDRLREEIGHLKNKLNLLGAGGAGQSMFSVATQKKEAMQSIAGLNDAYMTVDPSGAIKTANSKMVALLGFTKEEVVGKPLAEIDKTIAWAPNIIATLLREARDSAQEIELEKAFQDTITGKDRCVLLTASWDEKNGGTMVIRDETKLKQVSEMFGRYVSPKVIERMQDVETDFMATERRHMSVLFADLRGFTSMCTGRTPDEVKATINEYLTECISAVNDWEATVDKVVGDEVMALFGAPIPDESHAYRAVCTAIEIQRRMAKLIERWNSEGRPAPPAGIGVNSGDMVLGNIGPPDRVDYTVLGHNVNVAARLCAGAEGGEILITRATIDSLLEFAKNRPDQFKEPLNFRKAGTINAKGVPEPVEIIRVVF